MTWPDNGCECPSCNATADMSVPFPPLYTYQDKIEQAHWEEHDQNGYDTRTDYCPRECVADESRGLVGQIAQVWGNVLTDQERDLVRTYWGWDETALDVAILDMLNGKEIGFYETDIADAIEAVTELYWDGDVFRPMPCHMMTTEESN